MPAPRQDSASAPESFEGLYGVRPKSVHTLAWIAALILAAFTPAFLFPSTHTVANALLTDEHGPVELLTFVCFMAAAVASARHAGRLRSAARPRTALVYVAFAAFCLFGAMEEISWGESLIAYTPPAGLAALTQVNEQGELNLHNLPGIMDLDSAFVMLFGIAGLVGAGLGRRARFRDVAVPVALGPLFGLIAVMGAVETVNDFLPFAPPADRLVGALSEAVELFGAAACLATVWLNGRLFDRQRRRRSDAAVDLPGEMALDRAA